MHSFENKIDNILQTLELVTPQKKYIYYRVTKNNYKTFNTYHFSDGRLKTVQS